MRSKKEKIENANQNSENFDFSSLKDVFMSLMYAENPFPVDFDEAWRWIGYVKKANAKEVLLRKFKENVDFYVLYEQHIKISRYNPIKIYLTVDCFKMFCMLADTKRGDEVRLYYIALEKEHEELKKKVMESHPALLASVLLPYLEPAIARIVNERVLELQKQTEEGMYAFQLRLCTWIDENLSLTAEAWLNEHETRIEVLERLLQNFVALQGAEALPANFYVIQEGDEFIFKLGNSIDADVRGATLNVGNSKPLTVVLTIPFSSVKVAKSFEDHLHAVFSKKRVRGEWFHLDRQDLAFINQLALLYDSYYNKVWAKQLT